MKPLLGVINISALAVVVYLFLVGVGCLASNNAQSLPANCVNVFHPLVALFVVAGAIAAICVFLFNHV